ncbi:hypothetical protein N431DRAFT_444312 [Stipitochalara longipes BDJ]|nr:hypothetical protein N431DRAFT_444312 [Stipitochalara longipes BDJ]
MLFKLFLVIALAAITGVSTANPIVARDVNLGGPIPTPYCCINNCRICDWQECWGDPRECADTFFPGCCALMFARKRDEDDVQQAYNMKGELVEFITPAPALHIKRDEDGGKQYHNQKGDVVEFVDVAPQQSSEEDEPIVAKNVDWVGSPPPFEEQYCCSNQCRTCSWSCPNGFPDCTSADARYCCALWTLRKRDDDGPKEYYNQKDAGGVIDS